MRIMKYLQFTFLILLFYSCSNVKSLYEKESIVVNDKRSNFLIKKFELGNEKSILYFTESFNDNHVKVSGETIIFDRIIRTLEQLGFADSCIVGNHSNVLITIDNKNILIPAEKLKLYKFIYLGKQGERYIITYTNKARTFM